MQDIARFSQMEKLLLLLLMMIKQTTRTVENDQDRLAVKNQGELQGDLADISPSSTVHLVYECPHSLILKCIYY